MSAEPDYFVWIDPFQTISHLKSSLQYARADGANDVIRMVGRELEGPLYRVVLNEASEMARDIVRQMVGPHVRDNLAEALEKQRLMEMKVRAFSMQIIKPMLAPAVGGFGVDLRARPHDQDINIHIRVGTMAPVQYEVAIPLEKPRVR